MIVTLPFTDGKLPLNVSIHDNTFESLIYCKALSRAITNGADVRAVKLPNTNMQRLFTEDVDLSNSDFSGADFEDARLCDTNFTGADLTSANFTDVVLHNCDFTNANLTGADFNTKYLTGSIFTNVILDDTVIPVIPNIDATILSVITTQNFSMDHWHRNMRCGTTHCRAGWAITLTGEAGKCLEAAYGPAMAGALIYGASRPGQPTPNFFATNVDAIADMRRSAGPE